MSFRELKKIDKEIAKLVKPIELLLVNPINSNKEKTKFFASEDYTPQFKYERTPSYSSTLKRLKQLKPDNSGMGKLLKQKIEKTVNIINLLKARGKPEFTKYATKIYDVPSPSLINKARSFVKVRYKANTQCDMKTKDIILNLRMALMRYGVDWKVKEKDMSASAAVSVAKKTLFIRKNDCFTNKFLKRLIVHEIGTHILRAENGSNQPFHLFYSGSPNYLMTEEGLAVYNEERNGCLTNNILKIYAGRTLAINKALTSSFRDTYNYLRKYFNEEQAWKLTLRAKRGMKDTGKAGAFTKDHLYLKGYIEVKKYVNQGKDINKLYYGRIGLEDIEMLDEIPGLINPIYFPMFRYFKYFIAIFEKLVKLKINFVIKPLVMLPIETTKIPYEFLKKQMANFSRMLEEEK